MTPEELSALAYGQANTTQAIAAQAAHDREAREAESRRVDGMIADVREQMRTGFSTMHNTIVSEIGHISEMMSTKGARDDAQQAELAKGVKELAATMAATTETARVTVVDATAATTQSFNDQLSPIKDYISKGMGRGSITNPLVVAAITTALTLSVSTIVAVATHFLFPVVVH